MKDKSIIDAIASLRADLDRLESRVKEQEKPTGKHEIAAERLYWRLSGMLFDTKESYEKEAIAVLESVYGNDEPIIEYSTRITWREHKTRYNWPEIIKQYPEARWASTDLDGRVDIWEKAPRRTCNGWIGITRNIVTGGYARAPLTTDWADSLEKRPDYL